MTYLLNKELRILLFSRSGRNLGLGLFRELRFGGILPQAKKYGTVLSVHRSFRISTHRTETEAFGLRVGLTEP